ncbi:hypothetical protein ACJ73_00054 [Blastomyces percursus]|uniref:Uncharacterized protein n=1 Tax=Blastomyces percursus TaxID=1658174 RepID=A0A1J9RJ20_9EURO|nr:hypothetical protein ACJ73_00054 [Blastomyces percursus]
MARKLSQALRKVADMIDRSVEKYGGSDDGLDSRVLDDDELVVAFSELWTVVPSSWKQVVRSRGSRINSTLQRQRKQESEKTDIDDDTRKAIWEWGPAPEKLFNIKAEDSTLTPIAPLDNIIRTAHKLKGAMGIVEVQWRVLMLLIFLLLQQLELEQTEDFVEALLRLRLISSDICVQHLPSWRSAGYKYYHLAKSLGGFGTLIFLPQVGRYQYEGNYIPETTGGKCAILTLKRCRVQASEEWNCWTGHGVIDAVVKHAFAWIQKEPLFIQCSFDRSGNQDKQRAGNDQRAKPAKKRKRKLRSLGYHVREPEENPPRLVEVTSPRLNVSPNLAAEPISSNGPLCDSERSSNSAAATAHSNRRCAAQVAAVRPASGILSVSPCALPSGKSLAEPGTYVINACSLTSLQGEGVVFTEIRIPMM